MELKKIEEVDRENLDSTLMSHLLEALKTLENSVYTLLSKREKNSGSQVGEKHNNENSLEESVNTLMTAIQMMNPKEIQSAMNLLTAVSDDGNIQEIKNRIENYDYDDALGLLQAFAKKMNFSIRTKKNDM